MEREPESFQETVTVAVTQGRVSFLDLALNTSSSCSIHQLQGFQPSGAEPVHKGKAPLLP